MKPMTTISFPTDEYVLVPVDPTVEMVCAAENLIGRHAYKKAIAAVPDHLPGVVVHSVEPVGWRLIKEGMEYGITTYNKEDAAELRREGYTVICEVFTHPAPSQPSAAKYTPPTETECDEFRRTPGSFNDMVRAIHEHGYHTYAGAANVHFGEFYKAKFDAAIAAQPNAEAIVQAALEAAAQVGDRWYQQGRKQFSLAMEWAGGTIAKDIRALSAQQIIEEASK